jgi:hypothetical protein
VIQLPQRIRTRATLQVILGGILLIVSGCASMANMRGGTLHIEVMPGLYSILVTSDELPWSELGSVRKAWQNVADGVCGKGRYRELAVTEGVNDSGISPYSVPPTGVVHAKYLITKRDGYVLCDGAQSTLQDAMARISRPATD